MNVKDHAQRMVRRTAEFFEDRWFDRTRGVRTSGDVSLGAAGIDAEQFRDSEYYVPARPAHIRQALRALPVREVSGFSYVDLGCGKGRSLFVAAELPFRQIIGVELSARLHARCDRNIRSFRHRSRTGITAQHGNAAEFLFPKGDLVLYLFNPFGAATMQRVLDNLDTARRLHPCHVIVILLWPRCGAQVAALEGMCLHCETRQYQIFEAHALESTEH